MLSMENISQDLASMIYAQKPVATYEVPEIVPGLKQKLNEQESSVIFYRKEGDACEWIKLSKPEVFLYWNPFYMKGGKVKLVPQIISMRKGKAGGGLSVGKDPEIKILRALAVMEFYVQLPEEVIVVPGLRGTGQKDYFCFLEEAKRIIGDFNKKTSRIMKKGTE